MKNKSAFTHLSNTCTCIMNNQYNFFFSYSKISYHIQFTLVMLIIKRDIFIEKIMYMYMQNLFKIQNKQHLKGYQVILPH